MKVACFVFDISPIYFTFEIDENKNEMNYNLEVQKILLEINKQKNPNDKIKLLKQAVHIADVNNDVDWGIDLRLDILQCEIDTPSCVESFPAFIWILNAHENNPDIIDERDFLWAYKWMADESIAAINVSLEQLNEILEDFRVRLNRNGYSDRAYYNLVLFKLMFFGDFEEAHEALCLRDKSQVDSLSDGEAWDRNVKVLLALKEKRFDDAVFLAQDIISKKLVSEGLPFATLSSMVYYLAKSGDDRVKDYLDLIEKEISIQSIASVFLCNLAQIAFAFYITGEEEKAWAYFEHTAHWELDACDFLRFDYMVFMLPLLREKRTKILSLNHNLPYYRPDNTYNTEDIYQYYYAILQDLSKRFDERNNNTIFSDRFKEHLSY